MIYLRGHEGRGIGLINKLRAYRLQEEGFDTLDANLALGLPADARDYGAAHRHPEGPRHLEDPTAHQQPREGAPARERGVTVTDMVPLVVGVGEFNEGYLDAKRDRMGHDLPVHEELDARPSNEGTRR